MAALFRMERGLSSTRVEQVGRFAVESILTVTVGVLIGRLAWVAMSPADTAPPAPDFAAVSAGQSGDAQGASLLLTQMNPFAQTAVPAAAEPSRETSLDVKLAGVRAVDGNAAASSAIISYPDGSQKRLVPGDEVEPGVVLVNITPDGVHLSRAGAIETLGLSPGRGSIFAPSPMKPSEPEKTDAPLLASAEDITPAALVADTILTPEFRAGQVAGYRMAPRGQGAFEAAGLESGDLILRVNGTAVEGLRPDQISQSVARGSDVSLDVVRQGAIVRLRVAPGASLSQ